MQNSGQENVNYCTILLFPPSQIFSQIPILEKILKHFPWKFQLMKVYVLTSVFQQLEGIASQKILVSITKK